MGKIDKEVVFYIFTDTVEYYLVIKNEEILLFEMIWMDVEGTMLSEVNQAEKDKYSMVSLYAKSKTKQNL